MVRFIQPILLVFAKQSEKTCFKKQFFFYKKVAFARKYVPLYPNIRLLERDEWILLDKDPNANRQKYKKNRLPRCVKKAWSPVEIQ